MQFVRPHDQRCMQRPLCTSPCHCRPPSPSRCRSAFNCAFRRNSRRDHWWRRWRRASSCCRCSCVCFSCQDCGCIQPLPRRRAIRFAVCQRGYGPQGSPLDRATELTFHQNKSLFHNCLKLSERLIAADGTDLIGIASCLLPAHISQTQDF